MELTKDWGDMVVLASTSQETSSSVLDGLKLAFMQTRTCTLGFARFPFPEVRDNAAIDVS